MPFLRRPPADLRPKDDPFGRNWKRFVLALLLAGARLGAQELSFLDGVATESSAKYSSTSWEIDYRQDLYKYFDASLSYINEGHVPDHNRDGTAWEAWLNGPLFHDRISLSLGAGLYYFFDTETLPLGGTEDVHGSASIVSFSATGYFSDRWFCRFMVNRITPTTDIKMATASVGAGYWFGPHRRPLGGEPNKDAPEKEYVTDSQFTVFGGKSVVNAISNPAAWGAAAEYRQGLIPHLDGTVSYIYEGDPKIANRSGIALQLWPVNTFYDESTSVGIGVGPYIFIDRRHPSTNGRINPAAVSPLISLTVARHLSDHWIARIVWDRVTTSYNRDSDIFLLGFGYCR
jgi:hypothetical protein